MLLGVVNALTWGCTRLSRRSPIIFASGGQHCWYDQNQWHYDEPIRGGGV